MLASERSAQPCPELAVLIVDLKRTYLEMCPDLLRVYDCGSADGPLGPMLRALGFALVTGGPPIDLWALEMPAGSVDAWIAGHIEMETSPPATASTGDPALPPVASLSARERARSPPASRSTPARTRAPRRCQTDESAGRRAHASGKKPEEIARRAGYRE
jgi:hypothetical protein